MATSESLTIAASMYVDATYEGDLAASAGADYRVGRESTREFGERLAGHIFFQAGRILYGSSGEGDHRVQKYNFRVTMTDDPALRAAIARPADYDRTRYLAILPLIADGTFAHIFTEGHDGVLRVQRIPNGKADINDINTSPVGFGLPGENNEWPDGDRATRERIRQRHRNYALGLLYFVQNDPAVPEHLRQEAVAWGLARDEFTETAHFPTSLYVREARRVLGEYMFMFTQHDVELAPGLARTRLHEDSIAVGDYPLNSHGVAQAGPIQPTVREGYFVYGDLAYQIPYGVIAPRRFDNLLVPVAASASHVGFSALRMEPTWTALGQAAGLAAHRAMLDGVSTRKVRVRSLQLDLHELGAITLLISDVPPEHPLFRTAQAVGAFGFFHEEMDAEFESEPRQRTYGLQYFAPPARHGANLEDTLLPATEERWRNLLGKEGLRVPAFSRGQTRGAYTSKIAELNPGLE